MCSAIFRRSGFDAEKQHVACIAHVINLAVQDLLGKGGLGAGAPEKDDNVVGVDDNDDDDVLVSFSLGQDPAIGADNEDNSGNGTGPLEGALVDDSSAVNDTNTKAALVKLRTGLKKIRYAASLFTRILHTIHLSSWYLLPTVVTQTLHLSNILFNRASSSRLDKFKDLTMTDANKGGLAPLLDVCTRCGEVDRDWGLWNNYDLYVAVYFK